MANPKHRHTRTRRAKRRSHDALTANALQNCANCHEPKMSHRICPHCGHYRGKQIIEVAEA